MSNSILKTLAARRWIEIVGQRNVPGKPTLFTTTLYFLDDLKLRSLEDLPTLEEMKSLIEVSDKDQALAPEESGMQRREPRV